MFCQTDESISQTPVVCASACTYSVAFTLDPNARLCVGANSKPGQKRTGAAVRGANNGKLLPGEKKRLKHERMTAKRAARSAAHGLDLESINAELIHFVASDGDMKVRSAPLHAADSIEVLPAPPAISALVVCRCVV